MSKTDQNQQNEVQIQIKRSGIHWTCDDQDVPAVQRLTGLVKYLSKFLTFQRLKKTILDGFPMQKMISKQPFFRATADNPEAPPLTDTTMLPKQLNKATVAIPSKAWSLSVTPNKPHVVDAGTTRSGRFSKPTSYLQSYA